MRGWLLAAALLAGCSGLDAAPRGGPGPETATDAGSRGDAEPPRAKDAPLPATESIGFGGSDFPGGVCLPEGDAVPEDRQPAFYECDATVLARCPGLRSCCVGDGTCCSAVTGGPLPEGAVPLGGCRDGADAERCLAGQGVQVTAFGDPRPRFDSGLLPNGDGAHDSGLVFGDAVDLGSHRVELSATFGAPSDCGASCLEGVAVGFTADEDLGASASVRLLVGLVYSGSRSDVSLVVGNEPVLRWAMESEEETWTLTVRPDGLVEVLGPPLGATPASVETRPPHGARLVVYGHNTNRPADAVLGARLTALSVSTSLCDIPDAWPERGAASLAWDGAGYEPSFLHGPSIAVGPAYEVRVAFELDGKIIVAERDDATGTFELLGSPDVSVVQGDAVSGADLSDPDLLWTGAAWRLYYTLDGGAGIGMAESEDGGATFTHHDIVVTPGDLARVEQPTVVRHFSGQWVMVARITEAGGTERLAVFRSPDGRSWTRQAGGDLEALTAREGSTGSGFDADEIAHPSLVIHDGAWQLYYAGRRGTRWSVGLLASDELFWWRSLGKVLSGDGNGFDRIGTGAPDATPLGDAVELVYEGLDGAQSRLGHARRPATSWGGRRP